MNKTITIPLEEYERLVANEGKQFKYTINDNGIFIPVKKYIELVNANPNYDNIDLTNDEIRMVEPPKMNLLFEGF